MASIDFAALTQPLSDADPCGPDLDFDGDDDYLNFVANLEGLMPRSFFDDDSEPFAFNPSVINVEDQIARTAALLSRTRDLRLMSLMARLFILNRDIHGFARTVEATATLLETFWDAVHPRAENGAFAMRAATLGTLNESTVVFSLQYSRICESRRTGPVSFRAYLYAIREVAPREGAENPNESTILQAMRDAEEQTLATRRSLEILRDAITKIGTLWIEHADILSAPTLSGVGAMLARMLALINLAFPPEVAALAASSNDDGGRAASAGAVASSADAVAALAAAAHYFTTREPSSPVLPLVAQAQQLLGKTFIEVLQTLLPDHVGSAAYQIGGKQFFPLPVERLSGILPTSIAYGETNRDDYVEETSDASDGRDIHDETAADSGDAADGESGAEPDEADPDADRTAPSDPHDMQNSAPVAVNGATRDPSQRVYSASTRAQALGLLDQVVAWLRTEEPSSPVPWLIERARALADRDFLSVLRAVLPPGALGEVDKAD